MKFLISAVCVFAVAAAELQWDPSGQYRLVETAPLKSAEAPIPYPYPAGYPYPGYPQPAGYPYPGLRYMNMVAPEYSAYPYPYPGIRYFAAPEYQAAVGSAPFKYSYIQKSA